MKKLFKNKKTKNIVLIVLSCVLLFGAVFGIMALFSKAEEQTTKEISPSYAVGGLTADGKYLDTTESIYTKDAFECQGLKTSLVFDNNISYNIYFYDFDSNFVESTGKLTGNYNEEVPLSASTCRIVITPIEDSKVSWYEINGYASQLQIEVSKTQYKSYNEKFNELAVNLFEIDSSLLNMYVGTDCVVGSEYSLTTSTANTMGSCKFVDVTGYSKLTIKSYNGTLPAWKYMFINDSNIVIAVGSMSAQSVVDGVAIMTIEVPDGATQFTFAYQVGVTYELFGE